MFLIIVDTYSIWPEVFIMDNTDSASTIFRFRECFSRFGIANNVETDNRAQYTSESFCNFLSCNGVRLVSSLPVHLSTNRFAENSVKSVKNGLKKALLDHKNQNCLLQTLY